MTEIELAREQAQWQLTALQQWRDEAEAAGHVARSLVGTPFIPASLVVTDYPDEDRNRAATVANIAATLLTGQELGLSPMASLRSVDVIEHQPALRAVAMRALVQRAGHEVELVESTETRAVVRARRRRGLAQFGEWQTSTWTIDRAVKLNLAQKRNWRMQPAAMLVARATSEACRLIAADVLLGLAYSSEEIGDGPDEQAPTVARAPAKRTARRAVARFAEPAPAQPTVSTAPLDAYTAPEPEIPEPVANTDPAPIPDAEPEPSVPRITSAQKAALMAGFNGRGVRDRGQRLQLIGELIGRHVGSVNEMDRDDASLVLDWLNEAEPAPEPDDIPPAAMDDPEPLSDGDELP